MAKNDNASALKSLLGKALAKATMAKTPEFLDQIAEAAGSGWAKADAAALLTDAGLVDEGKTKATRRAILPPMVAGKAKWGQITSGAKSVKTDKSRGTITTNATQLSKKIGTLVADGATLKDAQATALKEASAKSETELAKAAARSATKAMTSQMVKTLAAIAPSEAKAQALKAAIEVLASVQGWAGRVKAVKPAEPAAAEA